MKKVWPAFTFPNWHTSKIKLLTADLHDRKYSVGTEKIQWIIQMFPNVFLDLLWFDQVDISYARQAVLYLGWSKWEINSTEISYINPVFLVSLTNDFLEKVNTIQVKFPMAEIGNIYLFSLFLFPFISFLFLLIFLKKWKKNFSVSWCILHAVC